MKEINTDIVINAPIETVWSILLDFEVYPQWNPFIKKAAGLLEVGATLSIEIEPTPGKTMTFKPQVITYMGESDQKQFAWSGRLVLPGLFDGKHSFMLRKHGEGCQLIHTEQFSGVLAGLFFNAIEASTHAGFVAMNEVLKARAEQLATTQPG